MPESRSSTAASRVYRRRRPAFAVLRLASTHLARVAVDAGDDGVAELAAVASLVEGLHHDGLAAGVAPGQQDNDLPRLNAIGV